MTTFAYRELIDRDLPLFEQGWHLGHRPPASRPR
jgi:hypothetical protein